MSLNLTPDSPNEYTVLRRMAIMLLTRALFVRLSQVASVLALGMKPHVRKKMEQNEEKLAENELRFAPFFSHMWFYTECKHAGYLAKPYE